MNPYGIYNAIVEVRIVANRGEPISQDIVAFLIRKDLKYGNLDEAYVVGDITVKELQEIPREEIPW